MPDFIQGTNNAANTLTGDQVIVEVQEILQSEGFGLFQMFARPSNRFGYTFTYKTPERLIPETYSRTTNGALGKGGKVPQVNITADIVDVVYFEIEDTEFASQVMADAEKSRLASSIIQSIMAQLDAEILDTLIKEAAGKAIEAGKEPAWSEAETQDELTLSRIYTGDAIANNESLIDAKTLGVPSTRQMLILEPKAYWRYINSFDTNVLEQSQEIKIGGLSTRQINGTMVIKHPMLGKSHTAGLIHETKAYDFSAAEGILVTDIAAAIPFAMQKQVVRPNKFGNSEMINRYVYGKGTIRPGLISVLPKTRTATP